MPSGGQMMWKIVEGCFSHLFIIFHLLAVMNADTNTLACSGSIKLYCEITHAGN